MTTKGTFNRTLRALHYAILFPSKHKSLLRAAESWQSPPRTSKHIKRLQQMTLVELWELSQQLKEENYENDFLGKI